MADQALIEQLKGQISSIESHGSTESERVGGDVVRRNKRPRRSVDPSSPEDALGKIVALVNVSDRSEWAIRERLAHAGFASAAIEEAVERAKVYGFIDDERYAAVFIRSRLSQGKGISGIEHDLRMQGIDIDLVPGWPDEFDASEEAEFERAIDFLDKKPPRSKNLRAGAYRKLVSKGFSASVAESAARAWAQRCSR